MDRQEGASMFIPPLATNRPQRPTPAHSGIPLLPCQELNPGCRQVLCPSPTTIPARILILGMNVVIGKCQQLALSLLTSVLLLVLASEHWDSPHTHIHTNTMLLLPGSHPSFLAKSSTDICSPSMMATSTELGSTHQQSLSRPGLATPQGQGAKLIRLVFL